MLRRKGLTAQRTESAYVRETRHIMRRTKKRYVPECSNTKQKIEKSVWNALGLSLIHISEPTRLRRISYAVFCLKKKKKKNKKQNKQQQTNKKSKKRHTSTTRHK